MNWRKDKRTKKVLSQIAKYQTSIVLALIGLALVGAGLSTTKLFSNSKEAQFVPSKSSTKADELLVVDISGAVKNPGVYNVDSDSRVNDVIKQAGGFRKEADQEWVAKNLNLAAKLSDGQKIYIPKTGEIGQVNSSINPQETNISSKVNINSATEAELDSLPGIGTVRAAKIIENRPYSKPEDLLNKKVLGEATFEKIKDQITVY